MKTPEGLNEEELKTVFADLKKQSKEDPLLQAIIKAREAELKVKTTEVQANENETTTINSEK